MEDISVNVATEVLGIMEQHQLEDENLRASAVTCALLHDICKAGTYRQTTKRQRGPDGKWQDVPAYEYDDSGMPLGHGEKSLFLLQRLGMELTDQEAAAIRWHMGAYRDHDCYNEMGKAYTRTTLWFYIPFPCCEYTRAPHQTVSFWHQGRRAPASLRSQK